MDGWDEQWRIDSGFRRRFVTMSAVWGAVLLTEAALRIPLIYALPVDVMVGLSKLLHLGTIALLVLWNLWYGRRQQARTEPLTPAR